ncbi:MAG: indole-3-glycerol phosphate synthase [Acidobacteriota bacterium]|jgi:indole-3-glycerol phosphate synthase|nr:indole-3-glycerol phosphate synthase [Acidobacteriota bacterium]
MDFLSEILALKRPRNATARVVRPIESLQADAEAARVNSVPHALRGALQRSDRLNVVAEFKRASPSKGAIRADADPSEISRRYELGGAAAVSVLTEEDRFLGSLDDLRETRAAITIPVLRKDFIFDDYQIYESAAAGADALLLIVAALEDAALVRLRGLAEDELEMDALVEVHNGDEMRRATAAGATLIGVNNRDLRSFEVSIDVSVRLAANSPENSILVAESGLRSREDLEMLSACGYQGFLIGETLMRAADPAEALRGLIQGSV